MERRKQILTWIREALETNLSGLSFDAFVFGSQANKPALGRADIDVGIIAERALTPVQLWNIYAAIDDIPMLYKIDLVDFNAVDDQFKAIALKNTEKL